MRTGPLLKNSGTLNLATGRFSEISSETQSFQGLTTGSGGTIYGAGANDDLYTLSTAGVATRYGTLALPSGDGYLGLTYSSGSFSAILETAGGNELYNIAGNGNSSTAKGTITGDEDNASGSLAYGPNGMLYSDFGSSAKLFTINPSTGAATAVGSGLGTVELTLVSDGATLYGINTVATSNIGIYTINTTTGTATQISTVAGLSSGSTLDTATFVTTAASTVPDKGSTLALLLGSVGLLAAVHRFCGACRA